MPPANAKTTGPLYVVLTGNPNCGKTTLFNALTGLRAKVGNYAGVTVERKEGRLQGAPAGSDIRVIDLPGTYSLSPQSLDEQISRDVLLNRLPELPPPALVVIVVDASNLQRNLYYTTQVIELGTPVIVALNMSDVAEANGQHIDAGKLSGLLGVPVIPLVASAAQGLPELKSRIIADVSGSGVVPQVETFGELPAEFNREIVAIAGLLSVPMSGEPSAVIAAAARRARAEALLFLSSEKALTSSGKQFPPDVPAALTAARARLEAAGIDWRGAPIASRYGSIAVIQQAVTREVAQAGEAFSDRLDRVLTHKVWGTLVFVLIMMLMFQGIFSFAHIPMDALQAGVDWLGTRVQGMIPPGELNSLLVDGVIAGVGAVVVFLPQILLLFLFIGFLEDTGYMARAAFLMDRLMNKVGLHGKSFIPMLSSFACAIPGIMATRTIESPKDRLTTILVAPLMSCSARLPVYTLLIGACITPLNIHGLPGLVMLGMYLLGIIVALAMAWLFKKTLLRGDAPMLIMELPPYKRPLVKVMARHTWDRSKLFLRRAGTVILGINILLWFLATYPKSPGIGTQFQSRRAPLTAELGAAKFTNAVGQTVPLEELMNYAILPADETTNLPAGLRGAVAASGEKKTLVALNSGQLAALEKLQALDKEEAGQKLAHSFAGRMGRAIEPLISPLGYDWKMGIGIVTSFAAREVFVSTMSTVYNMGNYDKSESSRKALQVELQKQTRPDGSPVYTPLTAISLMVFYVFALQCVSTVAIVRRETNSWKWPVFQWLYMGALAWFLAFITYQGGHLFGWK